MNLIDEKVTTAVPLPIVWIATHYSQIVAGICGTLYAVYLIYKIINEKNKK